MRFKCLSLCCWTTTPRPPLHTHRKLIYWPGKGVSCGWDETLTHSSSLSLYRLLFLDCFLLCLFLVPLQPAHSQLVVDLSHFFSTPFCFSSPSSPFSPPLHNRKDASSCYCYYVGEPTGPKLCIYVATPPHRSSCYCHKASNNQPSLTFAGQTLMHHI